MYFVFSAFTAFLLARNQTAILLKFSVNKIDKFWQVVSAGKTGCIVCKKEGVKKGWTWQVINVT